jgi:hypothetical protein
MTFDIAMHDAEVVHVEVHSGAVEGHLYSLRHRNFNRALHVQHCKQTVVHQLVHDYDVWNRRSTAHQKCNVWMSKDALHHYFVLNFRKQLVGDVRIENFLNSHGCTIEETFVDDRKATLTDLLADLNVAHCNLAHSWHNWQTT